MAYRKTKDPRDVFAQLLPAGCWEWQKPRSSKGYGLASDGMRQVRAHRLVWERLFGPIPPELEVLHTCDNPPCCRPNHLFLGTQMDNIHDAQDKGRFPRTKRHKKLNINGQAHITQAQADEIRIKYRTGSFRQRELAEEYGLKQPQVSRIIRGESWR